MRIHKINDNKLEVFIGINDLEKNALTAEDFMSSSCNRQNFLFNVLKLASRKANFNYRNCEIVLESFSIPAIQAFIITITRIPYKLQKNTYEKLKMNTYLLIRFNKFCTLSDFCASLGINVISNLFYYDGFYYLNLKITQILLFRKILLHLKEFTNDYKFNSFINENANLIVKDNAIQFCKKLI